MSSGPLKSLVRANRIIEGLAELGSATVQELAEEFDMPLSTMYEYVNTLETLNHITRTPAGRYRISTSFLEIGNKVLRNYDLFNVAEPEVRRLAEETGEFAGLMIEEDHLGVLVSMQKGEKVKRLQVTRTYPGVKSRLHTTAYGKAILAELSDGAIQDAVDQYGLHPRTSNTIADREGLFDAVERIRERGYALDDEECFEGMRGIGVSITSPTENIVAGIALYGPPNRLDSDAFRTRYPALVQEYADTIQGNLEY